MREQRRETRYETARPFRSTSGALLDYMQPRDQRTNITPSICYVTWFGSYGRHLTSGIDITHRVRSGGGLFGDD
jgi:hypothetical protein